MPPVLVVGVGALILLARLPHGPEFARYPDAEVAGVKDPHDFRGKPLCQACHPFADPGLAADPIELCRGCHGLDHGSHPVGVIQSTAPDPQLPLGPGGRVLCHSCHDPHDVKAFPHGLRRNFTPLCTSCHKGK